MNRATIMGWQKQGAAFMRTWRRELEQSLPVPVRRRLSLGRPVTYLRLLESSVELMSSSGGELEESSYDRALEELDDVELADLERMISTTRGILLLGGSDVLSIELTVPRKGLTNLDEIIALQLVTHSPLDPSAISWQQRLTGIAKDRVTSRVWITRRSTLEQIARRFAGVGLTVPSIGTLTDDGPIIFEWNVDGSRNSRWAANRLMVSAGIAILATIPLTTAALATYRAAEVSAQVEENRPAYAKRMGEVRAEQTAAGASARLEQLAAIEPVGSVLTKISPVLAEGDVLAEIGHSETLGVTSTVLTAEPSRLETMVSEQGGVSTGIVDSDGRTRMSIELP